MFHPVLPPEPEPPPETPQPTDEAPEPPGAVQPPETPAERPEDFMFVTGIVQVNDVRQVLVENRSTGEAVFLKKGDALGEGVIVDIGRYRVTIKEWDVTRGVPLGYSVSGKKDTYVPPPATPAVAQAPTQERRTEPPPSPSRRRWSELSPDQRRDYLRRRREAWRRIQEERARARREARP
jgi:hypothetical protein